MLGLFGKIQRRQAIKPRRRSNLALEALEARTCLTGPSLTLTLTLTAQAYPGHMVMLSGQVIDSMPGWATVSFSGAVVGSVQTDASGNFAFSTFNAGLGNVSATATDCSGLVSSPLSAPLNVSAPTVTVGWSYGTAGDIVVFGQVSDIDAGGRTVTLSGAVNGTVGTDASGSYSVHLRPGGSGTVIQAVVTDLWGLVSNAATVQFNPPAPVITDFSATKNTGNVWTFSGTVDSPEPAGCIVLLGGLSSLSNKCVSVATDGTFAIEIQLAVGESGTATAVASGFGPNSDMATCLV
jgi:hypothetical protein